MQRQRLAALATCLLLPTACFAVELVELIPKDAYGYAVVADIAELDAKLQSLGQRTNLPIPSLVSMIETKDEGTRGINTNGSIGIAVLPSEQGPSAVFFIPMDNYDAFVEQLDSRDSEDGVTEGLLRGQNIVVGKRAEYAAITWGNRRGLIRSVLEYPAAPEQKESIPRADGEFDIAAVLTSSGIQLLSDLAKQGLAQATRMLQQQAGEDNPALAGIQLYDQMLTALHSEVNSVTVSAQFDQQGSLRVNKSVRLNPSGKLAPMLREFPSTDEDLFAGVPNVPYVIACGGVFPAGSTQSMMDFSGSMMKSMKQLYGLEPDQVDAMMDLAVKYFGDMRGMSFLLGAGQGDEPLYNNMLAVMHVPDADEYLVSYRKYWLELSDLLAGSDAPFFKDAKLEKLTLDGKAVLKLTMPIPGLQQVPGANQGEAESLMQKLYGAEQMTAYMAVGNEHTVLVAYTNTTMLQKAWAVGDDESKQFSFDPGLARTREQLPKGALMVGYWSPSGTISFASRLLKMMPEPVAGFQLPDFPQTPPIGWSMRIEPMTVSFDTVVPVEAFEALGSYIKSFPLPGQPNNE